MKKELSRREFLRIGLLGGAAIAYLGARYYLDLDNFFSLPEVESAPRFPLPAPLRGVSVNSPFIWRFPEKQEAILSKVGEYRPATMRLFADDSIEPKLGRFNPDSLIRLQSFVRRVERMKEETGYAPGLTIDFGDSYGMLPRSSPVYGDSKPFSPYCDGTSEGYRAFYGSEKRRLYKTRMRTVAEAVGASPSVVAWGIINEASPPEGSDGTAVLTDWMADMVGECRRIDPKRTILTGLAHPWEINEQAIQDPNTVNTVHVYPFNPGLTLDPLRDHLQSPDRHLPLYPQEVGFPNRLMGRDFPESLTDRGYGLMVQNVLDCATIAGRLEVGGVSLWKLDGYDDGFPNPYTLPNTREMLSGYAKMMA